MEPSLWAECGYLGRYSPRQVGYEKICRHPLCQDPEFGPASGGRGQERALRMNEHELGHMGIVARYCASCHTSGNFKWYDHHMEHMSRRCCMAQEAEGGVKQVRSRFVP